MSSRLARSAFALAILAAVPALPAAALAHGGAYQPPPVEPPPVDRPPSPGGGIPGGPTTPGGGNPGGPTTPGGGNPGGPTTPPGSRDPFGGPTTPPDSRNPSGGGAPTTPGGGDVGGPTTPGGGPGAGPTTPGGGSKAPGTGPVTDGSGPGTGGGGITAPPPPSGRRTLPPSVGLGPDPDHWSRWWFAHRALLVDLDSRLEHTAASTPGGAPGATASDAMDRALAQGRLADALSDRDEDVASAAAVALGKAGDPGDLPSLVVVLRDRGRQQAVREAAALGIGLIGASDAAGSREATRALMDVAAKDAEPERLRSISVWALGLRRDLAAVPFLLDVVVARHSAWDVPAAATSAVGLSGCDFVREPLEAWLEGTPGRRKHETVRRVHAAHALAHLGDAKAVPALRAACRDDDEDVRRAAALALGPLADPADEETTLLLARMLDRDRDRGVRNMAAVSLGRIGSAAALKPLRYAYEKSDSFTQCFAALGLGLYARGRNDASVLAELRSDLRTRANADLRGALAVALGIGRDREAAKVLRAVAEDRGDPELRAHAALALGMIGDTSAAESLRATLADTRDPVLQRETATALGLLGDVRSVEVLKSLVEDGSSLYVQGSAAVALGRIGGADAAKILGNLVADTRRPGLARGMAAVGLGCLLDRTAGKSLARVGAHLDWYVRTESVDELMTIL